MVGRVSRSRYQEDRILPGPRLESVLQADTELDRQVKSGITYCLVWLMATLGKEGASQTSVLNLLPLQYVQDVSSALSRVSSGIRESSRLTRQVAQPPPETWLTEIGITENEFVQQSLDALTVVLYSLLDRCLHLTNIILGCGLTPRRVTYIRLSDVIKSNHSVVATALSDLKTAVYPLADPRHFFVHRGKHRESPLSNAELFSQIQKHFPALVDATKIDYATARTDIIALTQKDFETVSACVRKVKDLLLQPYMSKLNALGGIPELAKHDRLRARDIMNWAETGTEPPWSDESR